MPEELCQVSPKSHYVSLASHQDPNPCTASIAAPVSSVMSIFWFTCFFSIVLNFWSCWHFLSIALVPSLSFRILTFFTFWPLDAHSCSASGRERVQAKCHLQIFITAALTRRSNTKQNTNIQIQGCTNTNTTKIKRNVISSGRYPSIFHQHCHPSLNST